MSRPPGLIVYVPGRHGANSSRELIDRLRAYDPEDWSVEVFEHGFRLAATVDLDEVARELAARIDGWSGRLDTAVDHVRSIVLVGHSFGGVVVRAAWLHAGFDASGRLRADSWAGDVGRFVLIGSPNGGFRFESMPFYLQTAWRLLTPWRRYTVEDLVAGAPWVANLRLRWVDAFRNPANTSMPEIVQILGTRDDLVTAADIEDSKYLTTTRTFVTPGADHRGLVELNDPATANERWARIRPAIFESPGSDAVRADARSREPMATGPFQFLVHGIRASGNEGWVRQLESALGKEHSRVINYGFFSAIQFASALTRRKQTYNFIEAYCREYAQRDPNDFGVVGHSNGTYILGSAMNAVPAMRFHRIMLAGSVLPPEFNWTSLENQVGWFDVTGRWKQGVVFNERAAVDYPVGFLCSMLNGLGNKDIGAGGFSGFVNTPAFVREFDAVFPKGHGSALTQHSGYPNRVQQIATLMTAGAPDEPPHDSTRRGFAWLSRIVNRFGVGLIVVAAALAAIVLISWWIAAMTTWWIGIGMGVLIVLLIALVVRTV